MEGLFTLITKVEFTCPQCGTKWTEWQDPNDDWFKLATNQTMCANCGKEVMKRFVDKKEDDNDEVLSGWPHSHG